MLNAGSDRVDYRELLSPPPGYKVSFAAATTYSLDLETLTAACAIIGLNVEADTGLAKSPLHLLEAIRRASGKLLIFCQSGQIITSDKPNRLLPLLENCVVEISLTNRKSFHAKTWFVRYSAAGKEDKLRVIVMSRNLTFDRSWDVALRLDSADKKEQIIPSGKDSGEAMRTFIEWLGKRTGKHTSLLRSKRRQLLQLAERIAVTKWRYLGKEFDSFDFIPYGIGLPAADHLSETFHKMFVISPFLSKSVIEGFAERRLTNPDCTLITRKTELSKLNAELLMAFGTYTLKDDVVDGEEHISETGITRTQDIHAKVYLRTKGSDSELYIGSANASHSAFFGGNVECLIALYGKQRYLNVERLKQDLFGIDEKANPFERVEPQDYTANSEDTVLTMLESIVRDVCALHKTAMVRGDERYDITVSMKPLVTDVKVTLSPLMKSNHQPIGSTMIFSDLALRELSEWYVISAKSRGKEVNRVLKIQTTEMPENRDAAVFSDVIRDKNAFLTYIAFLLSDDYISAFLEGTKNSKGDFRFLNMNYDTPILYERMLKAAASSPESLREVKDVIELANDNIVPQEFLKLYEQFQKVVRL